MRPSDAFGFNGVRDSFSPSAMKGGAKNFNAGDNGSTAAGSKDASLKGRSCSLSLSISLSRFFLSVRGKV